MSASTLAPSPMIRRSSVVTPPLNEPSIRAWPVNVSFPSKTEPGPRTAFTAAPPSLVSPPSGTSARTCRGPRRYGHRGSSPSLMRAVRSGGLAVTPGPARAPRGRAASMPLLGALTLERPLELLGRDRLHQREHLAESAGVAAELERALHLERLGELLVADDALVDEVLPERLHRRRVADELMVVCDEDVGHIGGEQPNFVVVSFTGLGARP